MRKENLFILLGFSNLQENILQILKKLKIKFLIINKEKITNFGPQINIDCKNSLKILNKLKKINKLDNKKLLAYCGSEFGLNTSYILNKYFKNQYFSSFDKTKNFIKKDFSNNVFKKLFLKIPKILSKKQALNNLRNNKSVIIKPLNLSGSKGVELLDSFSNFKKNYLQKKKKYKKVLLQDFIDGPGLDVNGYIDNQKFFEMGIGDRYFSSGKYKIPIYGNYPSTKNFKIKKELYETLKKISISNGFKNTFIKGDFILKKNKIYLLEVSPRLHGDVFSSNTMYLNDPKNTPIELLLKNFYFNEPFKNLKNKGDIITVWHSIFFKKIMTQRDKKFFLKKLKSYLDIKKIVFREKKENTDIIVHKDNTTINGFFWLNTKKEDLKNQIKIIKNHFSDIIIVK